MTSTSCATLILFCLALPLQSLPARAEDHCWTSAEYVDLYFRQFNGQVPLPHLRKPEQKALFEHLIDACNLRQVIAEPISNEEKLRHLRIILAALGNFRSAYEVAVTVGEPLEQELAAVQAFGLEAAAAQLRIEQLNSRGESNAAAWSTMVGGVLESIVNTGRYTPSQAILMADAVTRHYPAISTALSVLDRERLRAKVKDLAPESDDGGLRQAIARMRAVVEALP